MSRTDKYPGQSQAGTGIIKGKQGIYEESATRKHTIGERLCMGDGRVFYYAKNSTQAVSRPGVFFAADIDRAEEDATITEVIGDKTIATFTTVGALGPAAVGGFFWSSSGTGGGQTYKIADTTASTTSGASDIHLHDEIKAALTGADCNIANNPFYGVARAADGAQFILGVALRAVTASYYFWLQTWGWVGVIRGDSTGAEGEEREILTSGISALTTSGGANGAQCLGAQCVNAQDSVTAEWDLTYLTIWP